MPKNRRAEPFSGSANFLTKSDTLILDHLLIDYDILLLSELTDSKPLERGDLNESLA